MMMKKGWFCTIVLALALASLACSLQGATLAPTPLPTEPINHSGTPPTEVAVAAPQLVQEGDLTDLYASVSGGVVSIRVYTESGGGQGSGFVYDAQGHIVTNEHVVAGAQQIEVDFPSGDKVWAELVGVDTNVDLAVLRVDVPAGVLHPLPLGDSSQVRVGEIVVAIGNPFGLAGTMTVGIVSALSRTIDSERAAPGGGVFSTGDIIQTDAAINLGNSGGPLVNLRGEVIGVNRAILTEAYSIMGAPTNSGVGFAIPVNVVRRVVEAILAGGEFQHPYLGVLCLSSLDLQTVEALGLPRVTGAYVTDVTPGGPADRAGIVGGRGPAVIGDVPRGGDLIVAIEGSPVREFGDLLSYLVNNTEAGQVVTLTVVRNGEEVEIPVTIGARP